MDRDMHIVKQILLSLAALMLCGCLELEQKFVLKADGSGELHCDYVLTPEALEALQTDTLALHMPWGVPIMQTFPLTAAEIKRLAQADGLTLRGLEVTDTKKGGRRLKYIIAFKSLRKFAKSKASALFRFQLSKAGAGEARLLVKSLGMDYLDWQLPRRSREQLERHFALVKLACRAVRYSLEIQAPGQITKSNSRKTKGAKAVWEYRGADLKLEDVVGENLTFIMPELRFKRPKKLKLRLPLTASPENAGAVIEPEILKLNLAGFAADRVLKAKGDKLEFSHSWVNINMRAEWPDTFTPVSYTTPVLSELILENGENLVVPLPPLFAYRLPVPKLTGPRLTRQFIVFMGFSTRKEVRGFERVRGSFSLTYAEGEKELPLPPVGEWPAAGFEQLTPGGHSARLRIPAKGRLEIEYEPKTEQEVKTIRFLTAGGQEIPVRAMFPGRPGRLPGPDQGPRTRTINFIIELEDDSRVVIVLNKDLRQVRVPFVFTGLKLGEAMPPVTIEDLSGRLLRLNRELKGHKEDVRAVAVSPDGKRAASAGLDAEIMVWDLATGRRLSSLKGHEGAVNSLAFIPGANRLISAGRDRTLRVWDLETGKELAKLEGHKNVVKAVAVSPDGRYALSGSLDKTARVWDLAAKKELHGKLPPHKHGVCAVAISPDGARALSAGLDRVIHLWDLAKPGKGKLLSTLKGHRFSVRGVAFAPDGKRAVSGAADMTVRLWDLTKREKASQVRVYRGHGNLVTTVVFLPDGKRLIAADMDGDVRIWDAADKTMLAQYKGDGTAIFSLAITPDGMSAIAGGRKGRLLIIALPDPDEE